MKLDRTEIGVLAFFVLLIVTVNAWWRVKSIGRQTQRAFEEARAARADGGALADGAVHSRATGDAGTE